MNEIKSFELKRGINLHIAQNDKFKTSLISFYLRLPLCRETVTKAALLARVLKRGTEKYPTLTELSKRAEELYGASLASSVSKKGDVELIKFSVGFVSDNFISDSIMAPAIELLKEFVLCPKVENNSFDAEYMRQEKENAKSFILGLINDKKEYARVKSNEIMFQDDPYGIVECGYVEDLEEIDGENLYSFYKELLETSEIDIFASGCFDSEKMKAEISSAFGELNERDEKIYETQLAEIEENIKVKNVIEEMPIVQSKLCMGFNCGISPKSDEYSSFLLFSGIYGGTPFSKLFNNVREKLSLAYYVSSGVDMHKGCLKINSGIEADNFNAAYDEIMLQLEKMKEGKFTDDEIVSAKKYLSTAMCSMKDSLQAIEAFYMNMIIIGCSDGIEDSLNKINNVSREQIVNVANKIQLDTIYLLKGVGNSEV